MSISTLFLIGAVGALVAGTISLWRWLRYTHQIGQLIACFGHFTVCTGLVVLSVHASEHNNMDLFSSHEIAAAFIAAGYCAVMIAQYINWKRIAALVPRR